MSQPSGTPGREDPIRAAFFGQRIHLKHAAWISAVMGVLTLVPSWYMFEVYGRVLNSRNTTTLLWLTVMVLGVYVVIELLDLARSRVLRDLSHGFTHRLENTVFDATFQANLNRQPGGTVQSFSDMKQLRDFLVSPFVTALLDIPAALLCLLLLFGLGVWLGALALAGAAVQVWLIWLTQRHTMPLLAKATGAAIQATQFANGALRNAQVIESMGMLSRMHARWISRQRLFLGQQAEASDYAGVTAAIAKMIQMMQGSVLLGGATWAMMHNQLWGGAGMIIVASILGGRALQPLALMVTHWRTLVQARDARDRVAALLSRYVPAARSMPLPAPTGKLTVEAVHAGPPNTQARIIRGVTFKALPGELTLIIGPTASGKSTLARLLVGVWPCASGAVRLDGADVYTWNKAELGPHIGYLPQSVELFEGTVAENVARFGDVDMDLVKAAVEVCGLRTLIEGLPQGYDTQIGEDGAVLSGGQRQRLGLARALYGGPRLLVLDEPNSSLDAAGDKSLLELLVQLKAAGICIVAITHRNSIMPAADKIVVLREGQVAAYGPRDEVLAALSKAAQQARTNVKRAPQLPQPTPGAEGTPA